MRIIRALLIYFAAVFIGGALLSPCLYWLVGAVAPNSHLANNPFHRYVDRSLLGLAILGIWPLLRSIGATSFRDVGLVKPTDQWNRLAAGFAMGLGSFAIIIAVAVLAGGRQLNHGWAGQMTPKFIWGTVAAVVVVPLLEEVLFRGALFGALRKACNWRVALAVSSMVYAIMHFMSSKDVDPAGPVQWYSGLEVLPKMLRGFTVWDVVIPAFFTLTMAGVLLGLAYQRTGNLYFSMGLHGGWIFWMKFYGVVTAPVKDANAWIWGKDKPTDGLATPALLVVLWVVMAMAKEKGIKSGIKKPTKPDE
jgi:membrane protease YdiL (CAAX protease family)